MPLLGCPFCREMFPSEEADKCPVCGVELMPIDRLPPSYETRLAAALEVSATPPEHRTLPWTFWRRGRGALLVLSAVGLVAFFAPWIELFKPDSYVLSGYHLARVRAGWFWGGAVGWFILFPLVASRRTIFQLRGIRGIALAFTGMTIIEVGFVLLNPPRGGRYVPVDYDWSWGLFVSAAASVLGMVFAARLGGSLDDIRLPDATSGDVLSRPITESSDGETVH